MDEKKRNHLTLEIKHFIIEEKARKPRKTVRDLVFDVSSKYGVKTSRGTIHRVLKAKEKILENMADATKFRLKRKRLIGKDRTRFESMLSEDLRKHFLKKNINCDTARRVAEDLRQKHPEFESSLQQINFSPKYFLNFFKQYGWKWGTIKGTKKMVSKGGHRERNQKVLVLYKK